MPLPRFLPRPLLALATVACATGLALAASPSAGAFSWQLPATTVSPGSAESQGADIAVAPNGTTTIVWQARNPADSTSWIKAATRPAGGSGFVLSDVSEPGVTADGEPRVAVSPDGTTTVVWRDTGSDRIRAATRPAGELEFPDPATTTPQLISDPSLTSLQPEVVAAGDGSVTAVWTADDASTWPPVYRLVQGATRQPGSSTFGPTQSLSATFPYSLTDVPLPRVAAGADGTTTAVWSRYDPARGGAIEAATIQSGQSTFGAAQPVSDPAFSAYSPQIAFGPDGQQTAAWLNVSSGMVQSATRAAGTSSFGTAVDVSVASSGADPQPQVAYAPSGQATVVWGNGSETLESNREADSTAWSIPQVISGSSSDNILAKLAVANDGRATAVWIGGWPSTSGNISIRSATRAPGAQGWSAPEEIATNVGNYIPMAFPRIGIAADGRASVAWTANTGGASPRIDTVSSDATSYTVDIKTEGTGSGTVTSNPSGIDCGGTCSSGFLLSTPLVLTASASSGSSFTGWGGACSGSASTCTVPLLGDRSVTATFTKDAPGPGPTPGPTPSNSFQISSSQASGSSIVTRLRVPGPGKLSQRATYRTRGARSSATGTACTTSRTANKAGTYTLTCRLNSAARKQRRDGRLRVAVRTTFTPTGGTARSTVRTVVFRSLKPRYTG